MRTYDQLNAIDETRRFIYSHVATRGAPPKSDEIARQFDAPLEDTREVLKILGVTKRVIVNPESGEIWMCGPFSAVATRFRVHGESVSWWANCAWDMLGIPASLGISATVETSCACCYEPVRIDVDAEKGPLSHEGLVHILLPARRWYDDIGFT
ncbi:MAG: organomercurial lyase [bacterium]